VGAKDLQGVPASDHDPVSCAAGAIRSFFIRDMQLLNWPVGRCPSLPDFAFARSDAAAYHGIHARWAKRRNRRLFQREDLPG
jgi:hypothetical protein